MRTMTDEEYDLWEKFHFDIEHHRAVERVEGCPICDQSND